jgi:hypothetical protein
MSDSSEVFTRQHENQLDGREARLRQIRDEAANAVNVESQATALLPRTVSRQMTAEDGYYGKPLLKAPAWTFEVPLYFFTGGAAGAAAIIAGAARITGADPRLAHDARYLAAIGGAISPALLIADLGMPSRFLNMLRVFKVQSPMSVGSWTLFSFSSSSAAAAFFGAVARSRNRFGLVRAISNASQFISLLSGAVLASYTGVLIGATAIPVWNENVGMLPLHFAASGMGAAAAMLELRNHETAALNTIGIAAAASETLMGASIELRKNPVLRPLKSGFTGWLTRLGGLLSGPLPLALRLLVLASNGSRAKRLRKAAAVSSIAGSVITRFSWTLAGKASVSDPETRRLVLAKQASQL